MLHFAYPFPYFAVEGTSSYPDMGMQALLNCIVKLPEQTADEKRRSKYPYAACEVLCCEVEGILGPLAADPDLLTILFSLLQAPAPLNATLAGYFARVVTSLLSKQAAPLHAFMQVNIRTPGPHVPAHLAATAPEDTQLHRLFRPCMRQNSKSIRMEQC